MTRLDDPAHTLDDSGIGPKKVYLKTFGCQMNVYDSERMMDALVQDGYTPTDQPEFADLVVLNTCHIREKAVDKVYSDLGRLRDIKLAREAEGHSTLIAVAGCVAQAEGKEITRRAPAVDVVVGPQSYHRLPGLLTRAKTERRGIVETAFLDDEKFAELPSRKAVRAAAAFLTIQEGCDKFCSFCVVPYTRGGEFSRTIAAIEKEARSLVDEGVREVTLLGQNVNAFHGEGPDGQVWSLARLIRLLASIDGLERIRYTTSHPSDMSDDLIAVHADEPKLMPYLHLPVQSGSDRMLSAMNRRHRVADYRVIIERMRAARPEIALSTDLIVGFPGETDEDFDATMALVHEVTFAQAYSFKYSSRPGTPAANLPDQIPEAVKTERLLRLQDVLFRQQTAFNTAQIGKTIDVLFDRAGRQDGQWIGRSPYLQSVHTIAGQPLIGSIIPVRIEKATQNSLTGVIAV